jgi:3-oxoacyl-[acyl-carrier protein] reductase
MKRKLGHIYNPGTPAFADRVVLVTGGAASLGRGISENLASRGATVIIADRDIAGARRLESEIAAQGGRALALEVDVTQVASIERMVRAVFDRYGRIDGLVNNAGILGPVKPLWETTDAEVEQVFDLNVRAVFACTRAVVGHMMERRAGAIVTISSVAGKDGPRDLSIYAASKAAVIGFTKSWGKELASYGVRVNCVSPSLIDATGMQCEMPASFRANSVGRIPMGRSARVGEVASVVAFLLSDEASFVTAACYDVSGGRATY